MEMKAPMTTAHPHPPSGGVYPTGPPMAGGILNQVGDDSVVDERSAKDKVLPQLKAESLLLAYNCTAQALFARLALHQCPPTTMRKADL